MYSWKRSGFDDGSQQNSDIDGLVTILMKAIRDLGSINKELKYSNWLKMIELKANGLYDEDQLKQDLKHFGLES